MKAGLRKRPFPIILFIILIFAAAFLARGAVRDYVARPLLLNLWQAWQMSQGFPQVFVWAFFIALIPVIAIFNLVVAGKEPEPEKLPASQPPQGQVQTLAHMLQRAPQGDYFKARLFRRLSDVTLDCLGYRERLSAKDVQDRLKKGEMALDPAVLAAIQQGWRHRVEPAESRKQKNEPPADWRDAQVETVIQYLESELDIERLKIED